MVGLQHSSSIDVPPLTWSPPSPHYTLSSLGIHVWLLQCKQGPLRISPPVHSPSSIRCSLRLPLDPHFAVALCRDSTAGTENIVAFIELNGKECGRGVLRASKEGVPCLLGQRCGPEEAPRPLRVEGETCVEVRIHRLKRSSEALEGEEPDRVEVLPVLTFAFEFMSRGASFVSFLLLVPAS